MQHMVQWLQNTAGNLTWALDNQTLFYVTKDKIDRPFKLWRHRIGRDPADDVPVFQEDDEQFTIHIHRTRDDKLLLLSTGEPLLRSLAAWNGSCLVPSKSLALVGAGNTGVQHVQVSQATQLIYACD